MRRVTGHVDFVELHLSGCRVNRDLGLGGKSLDLSTLFLWYTVRRGADVAADACQVYTRLRRSGPTLRL